MSNIVVAGATGKLGKIVCDLITASDDLDLVGAVVSDTGGNIGKELYPGVIATGQSSLMKVLEGADVYIDLTSPDAASKIIDRVPDAGVNMIIGTSAISDDILEKVAAGVLRNGTSALVSPNFSIGVNVFWKVCEEMARYLPDYDIEIVEAHHNAKKDAPSGTAAEALRRLQAETGIEKAVYGRNGVTGARGREIGIHSVRAGDIVGDHTVLFAKNMERLELTHRAMSRETFAQGCLEATRWIADKKDGRMHDMNEVLGI